MRDFFFVTFQIVGLVLLYGAMCVIFAWMFNFYLPLPAILNESILFAQIILIVFPIIGGLSIKFGVRKVYVIVGYVYVAIWGLVMLRVVAGLFEK